MVVPWGGAARSKLKLPAWTHGISGEITESWNKITEFLRKSRNFLENHTFLAENDEKTRFLGLFWPKIAVFKAFWAVFRDFLCIYGQFPSYIAGPRAYSVHIGWAPGEW